MYCQKCGTENPDDAKLCRACSWVLVSTAYAPRPDVKTSGLAITSLVLAILSPFACFFTALPAIIFGIIALVKISKSSGQLKGKGPAIAGITLPIIFLPIILALIFILWSFDADPIPEDYTIADLGSASPECALSYELLMSISEKGEKHPPDALLIGLSAQDVNLVYQVNNIIKENDYFGIVEAIKENAKGIYQAWENAKKGRDIIEELNTFPEIADLTEPDLEANIGFLRNIKLLAFLYQDYIYLQTENGSIQDAVTELIKLDSIFRKLSVNARSTVTKLVCYAGLNMDIRTANFIVNNPRTSNEALELLAEHFTLLTKEQVSLRNSVISEYLMFKKTLDTKISKDYSLPKTPFLKRNSMLRLYKNYCDNWINVIEQSQEPKKSELSVWPSIYPDWIVVSIDSEGKVPWIYTAYNPIGSILVRLFTPAMEKVLEIKTKLIVQDDLFQIVLNKRLGREISLKARAYSNEYTIDVEKKEIFSPGPDEEPQTDDDIKLLINPEALGLELE